MSRKVFVIRWASPCSSDIHCVWIVVHQLVAVCLLSSVLRWRAVVLLLAYIHSLNSPLQVGVCICAPFRSRTVAIISASVTPSSTSVQIRNPPFCDFDNSDNDWYGQLHTYVRMYFSMWSARTVLSRTFICTYVHPYVVANSQFILGMCVHMSMLWAHFCD